PPGTCWVSPGGCERGIRIPPPHIRRGSDMHTRNMETEVLDPAAAPTRTDGSRGPAPIELRVVEASPEAHPAALLVVGVFADGTFPDAGEALGRASSGRLAALARRGDLDGKAGATLLLYDLPGVAAERVLLVGLGPRDELRDRAYRDALAGTAKALRASRASEVA